MRKILITDFFGTLVPDDIELAEYSCGFGDLLDNNLRIWTILQDEKYTNKILDKLIILLDRNLKKYLNDGNIIKIVTSDAGHSEGIEWFLETIVPRFKSLIQYQEQIEIYFSDISPDSDNGFLNKINLNKENGETYFIYNNIKFGILDKKHDIFDIIKKQYDLNDTQLYSIGNGENDITMLLKCIELGGKSALIKETMYKSDKTLHQIIMDKAVMDYMLYIDDLILKENPQFNHLSILDWKTACQFAAASRELRKKITYEEYVPKRIEELYKLLNTQQLDTQKILEELTIYMVLNLQAHATLRNEIIYKNNDLRVYATFRAFKTKVLNNPYNSNKHY